MIGLGIAQETQDEVYHFFHKTSSAREQQEDLNKFLCLLSPSNIKSIYNCMYFKVLQDNEVISKVCRQEHDTNSTLVSLKMDNDQKPNCLRACLTK